MSKKIDWQYHSTYRGCHIEHRPGMKRQGWRVRYQMKNHVAEAVQFTLERCITMIDKLHEFVGYQCEVKE